MKRFLLLLFLISGLVKAQMPEFGQAKGLFLAEPKTKAQDIPAAPPPIINTSSTMISF